MSFIARLLGLDRAGSAPYENAAIGEIASQLADRDPDVARFLACFAYVLARVAHADLEVDDAERDEVRRRVAALGELEPAEADLVAQLALESAGHTGGSDNYLVTRRFRELASKSQRAQLMRCLYAVSAADGLISGGETNEIAGIGEELGFSRAETNALRAEWRDYLGELRTLPGETTA